MAHDHDHDHTHGHDHDHDHDHDHGHDHAHEEKRGEQTVTVEDVGPARKSLSIEVPAERIAAKIEENFGKLRSEAVLPGFRRGRAPQRLLHKRFGTSVRDDVKAQLLSECYTQAIEENKLTVIGEPQIKDVEKIELPESGPLSFKVEVEVSPTVELPEMESIAVNKVKKGVTDADVDEQIDSFRERFGKMVETTDATVQETDWLQCDVKIRAGQDAGDDAEEISHHPGVYAQVHGEDKDFKGHVAGILIEDLGKRLAGRKVGDTVSVSMTGPQGHEDEKIKDQPITVVIRIDKVERLEPAPVDELPQQMGVESVDDLKKRVREMIEDRHKREQQSDMHKQVCDYLLEKVEMELPAGLSSRQAERILRRQQLEMLYRGVAEQEVEQKLAEMRASSEEDARKQLKLFFILDEAARKLEVEVSESEINGRIAMMAMQQGRRPEKLRQEMYRRGELENLFLQMREQKTLDKILEKATVTEVDAPAEPQGDGKPKKRTGKAKSE